MEDRFQQNEKKMDDCLIIWVIILVVILILQDLRSFTLFKHYLIKDVHNFIKDVDNFIKDVDNFIKDVGYIIHYFIENMIDFKKLKN